MSKTRLQMRADMRLDLKDASTTWSHAELNRAIEKSISDFDRYLADDKTYELTLDKSVDDESVTFPADTDLDKVVDGVSLAAVVDGDVLAISAQPDVPRNLIMTITDASAHITNMSVIVKGTDRFGLAQEETLHYFKGITTVTGKKIFKTVNEVEVDQIDGNSSGETLDLGIGAYTDTWVYFANRPIQSNSESGTDDASNVLTRDTDYVIDYIEGKVKAIASQNIAASEVCTFDYKKIYIGIDLTSIPDLIRVQRVEYPIGQVPQSFIQGEQFGNTYFIGGSDEYGSQQSIPDKAHVRLYYDAKHVAPNDYAPGTIPEFLEVTVENLANAYALYQYALNHEHLATTAIAAASTSLGAANTLHTSLATALGNVKKYLDNNSSADAAGILAAIGTEAILTTVAGNKDVIKAALDAMNAYLDEVDVTDFTGSGNDGSEPALKAGEDLINTINVGGEGTSVSLAYKDFALAWQNNAAARTNAASVYGQEAAYRISVWSNYINQSAGYQTIAGVFARQAEAIINEILGYIQQALQYENAAAASIELANGFRLDADERRTEVYSIWRDRKQYIGDFTIGSVRQITRGE